jgi:hypothetical protein
MAADDLTLLGRPLGHTEARARLAGHTLTLDGALTPPGALPVTLAASIPLHTRGARLDLDMDGLLTAHATVPRQPLAPLVRVLPWLAHAEGEAAAEIVVAGTLARPYLASAQVDLSGGLGITGLGPDLPNRLEGADLRLRVSGDARRTHVALERLTGAFGWSTGGRGTGSVTADGTVDIPREALLRPMLWRWDLAGQVVDLPLPRRLAIVPRVSGVLRLAGEGRPRLTGVLAGQDMKIAMPAATSATAPAWGPFDFDPELSLVLEAGPGVRVAKSILRIPLRPTPLALPPMVAGPLDRSHPAFATTADLLRAGHPDELSGTWGLVTGSLDAPRVYARYEVDKGRLKFPLNLIGAIRNKHGHVTYDLQDGVRMLD